MTQGSGTSPLDRVLERLDGARGSGGGFTARCPAHDDRRNSLSIREGEDGRVLLKCFAGCPFDAIVAALKLQTRDLSSGRHVLHRPPSGKPSDRVPSSSGLTLAAYAEAKLLPVDFLRSLGLVDDRWFGRPAVGIPYRNEDGTPGPVRYRLALREGEGGEQRFAWRKGSHPTLYGLDHLDAIRREGWVLLVEGESDCHTLWHHAIPALGLPGADNWNEARDAVQFDGIGTIYVVIEPDRGGRAVLAWLEKSSIRERVRLVDLGEHKDPSGLYLSDAGPGCFRTRLMEALTMSTPWAESVLPPEMSVAAPFPLDVFPPTVRRYIADSAAALGVAPDLIAVPFLAIVAGTIGNTREIEVKPGWREQAILWTGVIAPPGAGKTPALNAARRGVNAQQNGAWERHKVDLADWERECGAARAAKQDTPPRPVLEHFYTSNITTEALAPMLGRSAGVTMIADELMGWVNSHDAYRKGGDRETYLSAWAGQPFKVDRRGTDTLFVPRPVFCVTGGIQPDRLPELRGEGARLDGFLDRFLLSSPETYPQRWTETVADQADGVAVEALFARLRVTTDTDTAATIYLSDEARRRFAAWYDGNGERIAASQGLAAGFAAKFPAQVARLTLILHTLNRSGEPTGAVPVETVEDAIRVVEYFADHLERVLPALGAVSLPRADHLTARIRRILGEAQGAWVDRTTLHGRLGGSVAAADLDCALHSLVGEIERRTIATSGRPRVECRMVQPEDMKI